MQFVCIFMSDIFSKEKRSEIMSRITGKDTKPEIAVRKYLFSKGYRYRKNVRTMKGTPDIVMRKYRLVIFINGCFWHGHDCKLSSTPKSNTDFWKTKIETNRKRDQSNLAILKKDNWNVVVIWECKLRTSKMFIKSMKLLEKKISNLNPEH